jgi:hypothetical protein
MFGWRKKNDGFDWHAYVRTTIKVRREARRERVDAARQAALDKAHAAGHAVVDGGKAAGRAAARGARDGAMQGAKGFSWVWQQTVRLFRVVSGPPGAWLMQTTAQLGDKLKAWDIAGPLALVGAVALLSGGMKWYASGFNADTAVPLGLGALLLVLAAPALLARAGLASANTSLRYGAAGLAALALGAGAYGVQKNGAPGVPSLGSLSKITLLPKGTPAVEGRA